MAKKIFILALVCAGLYLGASQQISSGAPPPLASDEYTQSFDEVKSLGLSSTAQRVQRDQTQIGLFWNGNIQDFWNEITQTVALTHHLDLARVHTYLLC